MKHLLTLTFLLALAPSGVWAQDSKPALLKGEEGIRTQSHLTKLHGIHIGDAPFEFVPTHFPASFVHTGQNHLLNPEALTPFFDKVAERHDKSVRVVQIGDSHVRGHIMPREVRHRLGEAWGEESMTEAEITYYTTALATETGVPGFVFSGLGKNGVTLSYYEDEAVQEEIAELRPDLLIISLGTNESHAKTFDAAEYAQRLDVFLQRMRQLCPDVQFLLTTPPGSHIAQKQRVKRRGRWVTITGKLTPNLRTAEVVGCQLAFATTHHIALWNLYELAGGSSYACKNWMDSKLMATDGVHFTAEGYTLQAHMLAEAILEEWNKYLTQL